jgi:hypothetical protein
MTQPLDFIRREKMVINLFKIYIKSVVFNK